MLFKNIKFNTEREKVTQLRLFNVPICEFYVKVLSPKKLHFNILPCIKSNRSYSCDNDFQDVFYLKVNNISNTSIQCIQHWVNIVGWMKADFYFVCDNPLLEQLIYERVHFDNKNIKFIKSVHYPLNRIVRNLSTSFWKKATYAHLTTFYHAQKNKIRNFWNIDADDTMLLVEAPRAAEILKKAKNYADENNLSAFSLDMHTSRTHGIHWSFGITYTRFNIDWMSIFQNVNDSSWMKNYLGLFDTEMNLDWYLTYLRDVKDVKNSTFYVDNFHFMHYGDFMLNPISWHISHWKNGEVYYPILRHVFNNTDLARIPISTRSIKIDSIESEECCYDYINRYLTYLKNIPDTAKNMWY